MDFELVIVGCGSAGVEAAKEALKYTKKILCVEKSPQDIGGTCLNRGCVPTKHLREGVYLLQKLQKGSLYGFSFKGKGDIKGAIEGAYKNVITPIRETTYKFLRSKGVKFAFTNGVSFVDRNTLRVGDKTVTSRFFLIATGSSPGSVPNVVPDGEFILDTDTFWGIKGIPRRVLIVGGGVSGVEFAHILKGYGAEEVYIVELAGEILPTVKNLSPDVVRRLKKDLEREGIKIFTKTVVEEVDKTSKSVKLSNGETLEGLDFILLTVGRKPNTNGLNLEGLGVKLTSKGYIEVNNGYRTSVENILAVGDVIPTPALAHVAKHEALLAVKNMFKNLSEELDYPKIPSVVYSSYELGSFGWGERELREMKKPFKVLMANLRGVARALSEAEEGLIKVFVAPSGEILGANVLTRHHTDPLLHEVLLAGTLKKLKKTVFAHPTVDEVLETF